MRKDLVRYTIISFLVSWIIWGGFYFLTSKTQYNGFGILGPFIAVMILSIHNKRTSLRSSIKDFLAKLKGIKLQWYIFTIFIGIFSWVLAILVVGVINGNLNNFIKLVSIKKLVTTLFIMIVYAFFEEVGWRGYALQRLQSKYNSTTASLILGLIWGMWHLPKIITEGITDISSIVLFLVMVNLFSILITFIYNNTNQSLFMAVLAHASFNAGVACSTGDASFRIGINMLYIAYVGILLIMSTLIIKIFGWRSLSREKPVDTNL